MPPFASPVIDLLPPVRKTRLGVATARSDEVVHEHLGGRLTVTTDAPGALLEAVGFHGISACTSR